MKTYFKIRYIFLFLFSISPFFSNAQNSIIVTYQYSSYAGYQRDMKLLIKDGVAKFIYQKNDTTLYGENTMEFYHYFEYYENFYDLKSGKIVEQRFLKDKDIKLLANWTNDLKWKISDETKKINEYTVQKAVVQAYEKAGRGTEWDYGDAIVWFAPEIPISSGPDRYAGLPGLILEVEFTKRSISYKLKEIDFNASIENFDLPTEGINVSMDEILRPHIIDKKWLKNEMKKQSLK